MYLKDERSMMAVLEFEDLVVGDGFEVYNEYASSPYLKVSETYAFNLENEILEKIGRDKQVIKREIIVEVR